MRKVEWWYYILALSWAWGQLIVFHPSTAEGIWLFTDWTMRIFLSVTGSALGFISVLMYSKMKGANASRQWPLVVGILVASSAVSVLRFAPFDFPPAWGAVGVLLAGFFFAWILAFCGEIYSHPGSLSPVIYTSISHFSGWIICYILRASSIWVLFASTVLIPLAMIPLLYKSRKHWQDNQTVISAKPISGISIRLLIGLALTFFAYRGVLCIIFLSYTTLPLFTMEQLVAVGVVTIACILMSVVMKKTMVGTTMLYKIVLLLFVAALMLLLAYQSPEVVMIVYMMALQGVNIMVWSLSSVFAQRDPERANRVLACVYIVVYASGMVGLIAATHFGAANPAYPILTVTLLGIALAFFLTDRAIPREDDVEPMSKPLRSQINIISDKDDFESRLDFIVSQYQLSPREREVYSLWCTGKSMNQIADALFISPSTTKTHIRHIYDKCGVRTREDIVSILENVHKVR